MRKTCAVLCSLALAACGSETTGINPFGVAQSVEVIAGGGQTVPVETTSDTIRVVVRDDASEPIPGESVNYEVDGPFDCGNWETSSLPTDQNGEARNVIHAGTIADTREDVDCTFRVVHASQGAPEPLVDSAEVVIEPGVAVDTVETGLSRVGATAPHTYPADWLQDEHGNPVPWRFTADSLVIPQADSVGELGRTLDVSESAVQGDSAVVCAWDESGGLIFPALARGTSESLTLSVQGHRDPDNRSGFVQPEDCI